MDELARLWNVFSGKLHFNLKHSSYIYTAEFNSSGTQIVTSSYDKTARIWDALTGDLIHTLEGHTSYVYTAVFSPDGTKILTASWDRTARLWDSTNGDLIHSLKGNTSYVSSVVFSPDGTKIIANDDGKVEFRPASLAPADGGAAMEARKFAEDGSRVLSEALSEPDTTSGAFFADCYNGILTTSDPENNIFTIN